MNTACILQSLLIPGIFLSQPFGDLFLDLWPLGKNFLVNVIADKLFSVVNDTGVKFIAGLSVCYLYLEGGSMSRP
jgi:hypothetical protein